MKKKLLAVILLGFIFNHFSAQSQTVNWGPLINKLNDSTVAVTQQAVVPQHQIFYIHSTDGKLIGTFTGGQSITWASAKVKNKGIDEIIKKIPGPTTPVNCIKTHCPPNAPGGAVCWDCGNK